ncbi:MAG: hypothetical protein EBR82_08115 [Caulobacteraceae bacterium]|nr:hypothetical protein [Caulobacteraceae bacterium]
MSVLHELPCRPDPDAMLDMTTALFANATAGKVELAWTSPREPHNITGARLFAVQDIGALVEHATRLNVTPNRNVYVSAGLRKETAASDRRCGLSDVLAVAALKADCDAPGCVETALQISEAIGIEPTYAMFTGKHPHLRGSLWWLLDVPSEDFSRCVAIERALQAKFGSDPAVCEPARVMRLAGSVAWPLKQGRVLEMTGPLQAPVRAKPYTLDELESALRGAGAMPKPAATATILDFSAAKPTLDLDGLIEKAREPSRWHDAARDAVAHLVGRGTPPDVVLDVLTTPLQQPGFSWMQTRKELQVMLSGALAKGMGREAKPQEAEEAKEAPRLASSPFVTIDDMLAKPPPDWLVRGYLIDVGVSVLFGPPGSFKSFIALDLALSVAHGLDWRGVPVREARKTLYICAEGQYGFGTRGLVWREHRGKGAVCAGFWMLPAPVNFLVADNVDLLAKHIGEFGVDARFIVIDTLAKNFGGGDENSTQDMNKFIAGVERLNAALKAHVLVVHHTGKDVSKAERGSSALRGGVDAAFHLIRDETSDRVTVRCLKQKDGPEPDDLALLCPVVEAVHPITGEVVTSRLPTLDEQPIVSRSSARLTRKQRAVLATLDIGSGSLATLAARTGTDKSNLRRTLNELIAMRFVRLTDSGVYELVVISETVGAHGERDENDYD